VDEEKIARQEVRVDDLQCTSSACCRQTCRKL
jgi:hypothetical protein